MEKEKLLQRTSELIDDSCKLMKMKAGKAILSGTMDIENAEDNYLLPKKLLLALLKDAFHEVGLPIGMEKDFLKEVNNIYSCI